MEYINLPPQTIFQRHYLKKNQPVIITDVTSQWQAMTKWTFEWFKQSYGDVIVPVIMGHANYSKKVRYGWWHRVTSLESSISINQWWMTPNMLLSRKIW